MSPKPNAPVFFSALARTAPEMLRAAGADGTIKPEQALAWLKSRQKEGKFKADEMDWSGVEDWLSEQKGRVAVADIVRFVEANGVQVIEVEKGRVQKVSDVQFQYVDAMKEGGASHPEAEEMWSAMLAFAEDRKHDETKKDQGFDLVMRVAGFTGNEIHDAVHARDNEGAVDTKYGQYVLPGGENYRELLLTLPTSEQPPFETWVRSEYGSTNHWGEVDEETARQNYAQKYGSSEAPESYISSHWDEKNIVLHVRFNDRVDVDGKRVIFLEELQSDWAQEGLKKGFGKQGIAEKERAKKDAEDTLNTALSLQKKAREEVRYWSENLVKLRLDARTPSEDILSAVEKSTETKVEKQKREYEAEVALRAFNSANTELRRAKNEKIIPAGPFVNDTKSWLSLGIKRMIRYAAENGYDKIAFVNGQQSADRYDLSQKISKVEVCSNIGKEAGFIQAYDLDGDFVIGREFQTYAELEDIIGKEASKKVTQQKPSTPTGSGYDEIRTLTGLDLKIGGDGMRTFYDKIVPQTAADVLKKLGGGKVEQIAFDATEKYLAYVAIVGDAQGGFALRHMKDRRYFKGDSTNPDWSAEWLDEGRLFATKDQAEAMLRALIPRKIAYQSGFTITPELRAKALAGLPLFSVAADPIGYDALRTIDPFLKKLADQGKIILHRAAHTLPVKGRLPVGVQGLTTDDGTIHVVANTLSSAAGAVVLHEAFHAGVHALIGSTAWNALQVRLGELYRQSGHPASAANPFWAAARDRVEVAKVRGAVAPGMEHEEFGAYAIEEFAKAPKTVRKWVDDLVGTVKAWSLRRFGKQLGDVTPAQLTSLAKLALLDAKSTGHPELSPAYSTLDQVSTPAFKRWFGNSQVTDDQGLPKVTYHGTAYDFSRPKGVFWSSSSPDFASFFSEGIYADNGQNVMPVFLKVEKPMDMRGIDLRQWLTKSELAAHLKVSEAEIDAGFAPYIWGPGPALAYRMFEAKEFVRGFKRMGYDGVRWSETITDREIPRSETSETWAAFNATQVKSAVGNNGNFDPRKADINFSVDRYASPEHSVAAGLGDAVKRSAENSRGQSIAVDEHAQANFWQWAGDTKVVDEQGRPLVVFHGTKADFSKFNPKAAKRTRGGEDLGDVGALFFTNSPDVADAYAGVATNYQGKKWSWPRDDFAGGRVMPVYLSIKNPLVVETTGEFYAEAEKRIAQAKADGYDGLILRDVLDTPGAAGSLRGFQHTAYVVFDPLQIKSAVGNMGAFDVTNPDIRYSVSNAAPPKLLYHGTNHEFTDFRPASKSINTTTFGDVETERTGIFLSDNPEFSAQYGKKLMQVQAAIDNPAEVTRDLILDFADSLDPFGPDRELWILARSSKSWGMFEGELGRRFVAFLQEQGYDGATFPEDLPTDEGEVLGNTYVAFSPGQIQIAPGTDATSNYASSPTDKDDSDRKRKRPRL